MWTYIDGLGWKFMTYSYNSQNQAIRLHYEEGQSDTKAFGYAYDAAGRLNVVNYYTGSQIIPPPEGDNDYVSSDWLNFAHYSYNQNSQLDTTSFNSNGYLFRYGYNNRIWVQQINMSDHIFRYVLLYNANGTIRYQDWEGSYYNNFSDNNERRFTYIYDNSNRLLISSEVLSGNNTFGLINAYDGDGNFQSMKRYDSKGNLADNFSYAYNTGTNRLNNVSGAVDEYTYDNNGNVTKDDMNHDFEVKYDYRNLMTESKNNLSLQTFWIKYFYDEAGNRIRKMVYLYDNSGIGGTDAGGTWNLTKDEFYVRDVSGKEIAIYYGSDLQQWNVFGLDNAGNLDANNHKFFYLKDHLGSVHAVIDSTNTVVSAQDYDCWGYIMDGRSFTPENSMYKFTGKERDKDIENNYDYFGARYYNSRIGRWGSEEPKLNKFPGFTPYGYVFENPISLFDIDGQGPGGPNDTREPYMMDVGGGGDLGAAVLTGMAIGAVVELVKTAQEVFDPKTETIVTQQEQVVNQTGQNADVTNPSYQSGKEQGIETRLSTIQKHLNKWDALVSSGSPDPHNWKKGWKETIEKTLKEIGKKVKQLGKESIEELLHKFKNWNKEDIMKLMERVQEKGIEPSDYIK